MIVLAAAAPLTTCKNTTAPCARLFKVIVYAVAPVYDTLTNIWDELLVLIVELAALTVPRSVKLVWRLVSRSEPGTRALPLIDPVPFNTAARPAAVDKA